MKHKIEINKLGERKIVIKGKKLTLQWVSIPTISEHCLLVYSEDKK